ncbi:hypothetical protein [[Mycoplasma] gypis]|uniref:Yip1 domain-containing protein n=1 Tax=[Mycoplasma] gypis TaxID=92404 RepID=A0ABZ2RMU4_9BACT|nr:hypothetical protein [[Mycoplasma] gypis]MBN0919528.1 hypothetical protein [[Mycoplasma] gypis]
MNNNAFLLVENAHKRLKKIFLRYNLLPILFFILWMIGSIVAYTINVKSLEREGKSFDSQLLSSACLFPFAPILPAGPYLVQIFNVITGGDTSSDIIIVGVMLVISTFSVISFFLGSMILWILLIVALSAAKRDSEQVKMLIMGESNASSLLVSQYADAAASKANTTRILYILFLLPFCLIVAWFLTFSTLSKLKSLKNSLLVFRAS